jgi:hypothetical protein
LYRLNAQRMKEKRLMQTSDRFLTKRHPKYKFIIAEEQVDESRQKDKNPTQSPARSLQLGQYSQECEEGSTAFNTIRDIPAVFYNVGMMCNMFCAHLGVENRVLNFSYAIMGLPVYQNENNLSVNCNYHGDNEINPICKDKRGFTFLPDALGLAKPCRLFSPLHVIAVIVVACKFCPGWDTWEVRLCQNNSDLGLNSSDSHHLDDDHCSDDTLTSSSLDVIVSHNKKNNAEQKRGGDHEEILITKKEAVSSNELKSLYKIPNSNGERTLDYLDFITKSENKDFTSVDFKTSISSIPKTSLYRQKRNRAVSGNSVLKKEMDSRNAFKNRLFSECGLSEYLAYYRSASEFSTGVHGPYLTLISYIADRLCVKRKELHLLVMQFDEEIVCHAEKRKAFLSLRCFDNDPVYDLGGNLLTSSSTALDI